MYIRYVTLPSCMKKTVDLSFCIHYHDLNVAHRPASAPNNSDTSFTVLHRRYKRNSRELSRVHAHTRLAFYSKIKNVVHEDILDFFYKCFDGIWYLASSGGINGLL